MEDGGGGGHDGFANQRTSNIFMRGGGASRERDQGPHSEKAHSTPIIFKI